MGDLVINPEMLGLDRIQDRLQEVMRSYLRDANVPTSAEILSPRPRIPNNSSVGWELRLSALWLYVEGPSGGRTDKRRWRDHPTIRELAGLLRESAEHSPPLPFPVWLRRYMADRFDGTLHLPRGRKPNPIPRDVILEHLHLLWRVEEKRGQYKRNGIEGASVERAVGEVATEPGCQLTYNTLLKYRRMALRRHDVRPLLLWARRPDERSPFDEARVEDVAVEELSLWVSDAQSTSRFSDQEIRAILRRLICGPREQD